MSESTTETIFPSSEINSNLDPIPNKFVERFFSNLKKEGPGEKSLLVIGSGGNTEFWKNKGAATFDIDPNVKADFTGDANNLSELLENEKYDLIFAECLTLGERGVKLENLLNEAYQALSNPGILLVETSMAIIDPKTKKDNIEKQLPVPSVPTPIEFFNAARDTGFNQAFMSRSDVYMHSDRDMELDGKTYPGGYLIEAATKYFLTKLKPKS